jgi:hypothetical protein
MFVINYMNRLMRIFRPKRDEVTGEWRRLHNEELFALYFSPNIIRLTKSTRMRWAGHVAPIGRVELHTGFYWGNLREGGLLEDQDLDGRIILKWVLEILVGAWTGSGLG